MFVTFLFNFVLFLRTGFPSCNRCHGVLLTGDTYRLKCAQNHLFCKGCADRLQLDVTGALPLSLCPLCWEWAFLHELFG